MSGPRTLRFRFSLEKLVNSLAHFAASGVQDLTKLKAAKLLYLADRDHLYRYGRPITGDRYLAMEYGPVPEDAFELIGRLTQPLEVSDAGCEYASEWLKVQRALFYKYPVLRAKKRPDLAVFSESEIDALNRTLQEYGSRSARQLVDLTHEHKAYQLADRTRAKGSSEALPYEFFFEDAPPSVRERALCLAERQQDAFDFADLLRRAGADASARQSEQAIAR